MLADLGADKHTLIMRNHGMLSIGATLGEAFGFMRALIDACTLQMHIMATGRKLRPIPPELQAHTKAQMTSRTGNGAARRHLLGLLAAAGRAARSVVRGLSAGRFPPCTISLPARRPPGFCRKAAASSPTAR